MKNSVTITWPILILLALIGQSCKKEAPPTLSTLSISNITVESATSGGKITSDGGSAITSRGICWGTNSNPVISGSKTSEGIGPGEFTSNLTGLQPGTSYHVRAYAINSSGTGYGAELSFITLGKLPVCKTLDATNITSSSATLHATVNANNLSTDVVFEFGSYSGCKGSTDFIIIHPDPGTITGNSEVSLSADISGLEPHTTYVCHVKANNSLGTVTGNDISVRTQPADISFNPDLVYGSLEDVEGNIYKTIQIGSQTWMAENLKTTRFSDGQSISTTMPATLDIMGEDTPGYQWAFDGSEYYTPVFGRLYTWYAVTDYRNICPDGWHVPTLDEWTALITYLGGEDAAGNKLKEAGTVHWALASPGVTNESGFSAVGSGHRYIDSYAFYGLYFDGGWWSSTEESSSSLTGWNLSIEAQFTWGKIRTSLKRVGYSVRCLKD